VPGKEGAVEAQRGNDSLTGWREAADATTFQWKPVATAAFYDCGQLRRSYGTKVEGKR
jgi:hypothetical protein